MLSDRLSCFALFLLFSEVIIQKALALQARVFSVAGVCPDKQLMVIARIQNAG